ncbi:MAG: recombination-associated protein RdgC [Myxococcales bacterium]|nr:recombination-associated protein RdgC [Myxococcales bacterium]
MGALSGGITLRRYRVNGSAPKDFKEAYEKSVRAHVLVPINVESNEDKSLGWSSIFDENDLDLSFDKFFFEGHIMLALRQDTLKPPAAMVKRLLKQRQQHIESERGQLLSAAALRDLKAILVAELRKTTPPKTRTVDVVWNLEEQRLAIYSHAKSMNEALLALFSQTFNLGLDIEGPALWAKEQSEHDSKQVAQLKSARPTLELLHGFVGLRPTPHGHEEGAALASALRGELSQGA